MEVMKELKKPEVAAAAGAVGALVVAMFVPAALLLAAGAATAGGVYLYNNGFARPKDAKDEVINVKPEEGGEEK